MKALIVIWAIVTYFCVFMLWRNQRVYDYRRWLIEEVSKLAQQDIRAGREWEWRYEAMRSVGYQQMVFRFWRRLHRFYKDTTFLEDAE